MATSCRESAGLDIVAFLANDLTGDRQTYAEYRSAYWAYRHLWHCRDGKVHLSFPRASLELVLRTSMQKPCNVHRPPFCGTWGQGHREPGPHRSRTPAAKALAGGKSSSGFCCFFRSSGVRDTWLQVLGLQMPPVTVKLREGLRPASTRRKLCAPSGCCNFTDRTARFFICSVLPSCLFSLCPGQTPHSDKETNILGGSSSGRVR